MISIRQSTAVSSNVSLDEIKAKPRETNSAWLKRVGARDGVLLLGGAAISHFRIRVAQSHARADLKPSCWSLAALLMADQTFLSVPLELCAEASDIAQRNGVRTSSMADYNDPARFPNIAVIRFTTDSKMIFDLATLVSGDPETKKPAQRNIIDLPTLMLPWLSYIWIAGKASNPLSEGLGLPSAAFVETVYGMAGIELTPGLASATSCPEAIWQAAKYWQDFYKEAAETSNEKDATKLIPSGQYAIRQKAAAADWPREAKR
jgi:hypothetical protein